MLTLLLKDKEGHQVWDNESSPLCPVYIRLQGYVIWYAILYIHNVSTKI